LEKGEGSSKRGGEGALEPACSSDRVYAKKEVTRLDPQSNPGDKGIDSLKKKEVGKKGGLAAACIFLWGRDESK